MICKDKLPKINTKNGSNQSLLDFPEACNPEKEAGAKDGQVAIVTGADRGIGRAIAITLARNGIRVVVNYLARYAEGAFQTVKEIEACGGHAIAVDGDVTNNEQVSRMIDEALRAFQKVDIFVSNAGIASRGYSLVDSNIEEVQRLFDIHVLGAMRFVKLLVPIMRELGGGAVVFISSQFTQTCEAFSGPYVMAKTALEAMARTLAREERGSNIRVNVVAPSITETEMGIRYVKARFGVNDVRKILDRMPFGRLARPEDIAEAVAFLVSDKASYITGQIIFVNGGGW